MYNVCLSVPFFVRNVYEWLAGFLCGGDGLAAKDVLKCNNVKEVTLIDSDSVMTDLCRTHSLVTAINSNALSDERVTVLNQDGYEYIKNNQKKYDVIIVDFPDPNNES